MNYYDAKWKVGEFTKNLVRIITKHSPNSGDKIAITPNAETFF